MSAQIHIAAIAGNRGGTRESTDSIVRVYNMNDFFLVVIIVVSVVSTTSSSSHAQFSTTAKLTQRDSVLKQLIAIVKCAVTRQNSW